MPKHFKQYWSKMVERALLVFVLFVVLTTSVIGGIFITRARDAQAAQSNTVNFQARLLTSSGSVVPDGYYHVEFKLYKAATSASTPDQGACTMGSGTEDTNCLWSETRTGASTVRVANGYLTVNLGAVTPFPSNINWDQETWLSMRVGGMGGTPTWEATEMNPRLKLTAVPYAFTAGKLVGKNGTGSTTLDVGTTTNTNVIHLPDESGTICLQNSANCGFATTGDMNAAINGAVSLQSATPGTAQTGNFNITGVGILGTKVVTPAIDTASAVPLNIGSSSSVINLNQATAITGTLSATGAVTFGNTLSVTGNTTLTTLSTTGSASIGGGLTASGDITTSTGFKVGTNTGITNTCTAQEALTGQVITGGITTGGSCYNLVSAGVGSFVALQSGTPGSAETGSMNITGTGIFGAGILTPTIDAAGATALTLGGTNATSVVINENTTVNGTFEATGAATFGNTITADGNINTKGVYQVNGVTGVSSVCTPGQARLGDSITGGITTGSGTCTAVLTTTSAFGGDVSGTYNNIAVNKLQGTALNITSPLAGNMLVYDATNGWTNVAMSGDVTISSTGVATIADNAITTVKVADGAITELKLADSSVTSSKIVDGTIVTADISVGGVTSSNILDGTVSGSDLAANSVTTDKITNGTVLGEDIASGTVTGSNIANATITNTNLQAGTFANITGTGELIAGSINTGFGTINTANNITTTATVQGSTVIATGALQGATLSTTGAATFGSTISADGSINTNGMFTVNGIQISSANLSNDANLAKLDGTQTFTGNNTFGGMTTLNGATTLTNTFTQTTATNSANAFQIQNSAGTQVLNVDTVNSTLTLRAGSDSRALGPELYSGNFSSGWTTTGWDVTTDPTKATHLTGNTNSLVNTSVPIVAGKTYQVTIAISGSCGSGPLAGFLGGTQFFGANYSCSNTFSYSVVAANTTSLTLTSVSTWTGTISDISVKEVTGLLINPALVIQNASGTPNIEIRTSSSVTNAFVGLGTGGSNVSGVQNTAFGSYAMQGDLSGSRNSAFGYYTLKSNTTGYSNTAIGNQALQSNTVGYSNTGIGSNTLRSLTTGFGNTAIGDSAMNNSIGAINNVAIGLNSLYSANVAVENVAVGNNALSGTTNGGSNTAVGFNAGKSNTGGNWGVFVGANSGNQDMNGLFKTGTNLQRATAIGTYAQVQANDSIVLGSVDNLTKVGIGITVPSNMLSVSPLDYQTGTVTRTNGSNQLVGTGTAWTSLMAGDIIVFADGTTNTVQSVTDDTHLVMYGNWGGATDVTPIAYRFHKKGFNVTSTGKVGIGKVSPAYDLDVQGDINLTGAYRINGTAGATTTCAAGEVLTAQTVNGGITTGGTCASVVSATGGAGGDLSGTFDNLYIEKLQGTNLNISGPQAGHVLIYDTVNGWTNVAVTGDATITSAGVLTITNGAITTAKLGDGAVTTDKLAADAVTTDKIATGAVGNSDLAANAVTTDKITNGTVLGEDIASGTVTGSNIANATITNTNLQAGTFANITGTGELIAGSINTGFGAINTTNNITTTATVQGSTVIATGALQGATLSTTGAATIGGSLGVTGAATFASTISADGNINTNGMFTVNGVQISSANLSNDANLAKLDGTQTFTGNNTFSGTTNITGTLQINGTSGATVTCTGSQVLLNHVVNGGVTTSGTCGEVIASIGGAGGDLSGSFDNLYVEKLQGTLLNITTPTNGQMLVYNTTTGWTNVSLSGDATISTTGVLTIANGAITTVKVADSAITTVKLADSSVTSSKIVDGTIVTADLADNAVTTAKVADSAITTIKLADGAVTGAKLATDAVTTDKIATGAVGNTDLAANAVTTDKITDGTVTGTDLATGTITNTNLQAGTFANITGTGALSAGSINNGFGAINTGDNITTTALVQGGTINTTGTYQVNGTQISSANLSNDANLAKLDGTQTFTGNNTFSGTTNITGTLKINGTDGAGINCTAAQVVTGQVVNGGIVTSGTCSSVLAGNATAGGDVSGTFDNLSVNKLQGTNLNITSPVAGQMLVYTASGWTNVALSGDATISTTGVLTIANSAITTIKLADNSVTSLKIVDGAVATADLADLSVTTAKVADSAITTIKLADGAVTTDKLGADAVTTDKIATGAVGNTDLAANAVTTDKITDGTIANADLQAGTFSNITGTGVLTAGSINTGFGTINTANNITTTATVQGGTINATTKYQINGTDGLTKTCAAGQVITGQTIAGGIVTATDAACADVLTTSLTLAGDVSGSYSSTTVNKLQGTNLNITSPVAGQMLVYTASGWTNVALSGDATISTTGVLTIANSAITTVKVADSAITSLKIADGTVTGTDIATGTITNTNLQAGTFSNITGTGALSAGSITTGFGPISTGSNITTTATISGATVNTSGTFTVNGVQISSAALSNDANLAKLDGTQTFTGANTFSGAVTTGSTVTNNGAVTNNSTTTLNGATTLTNTFTQTTATDTATAFQIQNSVGTSVFTVDTLNSDVVLRSGTDTKTITGLYSTTDFTTGWTMSGGTGWTLTAANATHITGNSNTLTYTAGAITAGTTYRVTYTISGACGGASYSAAIGGSTFTNANYVCVGSSSFVTTATTAGQLVFTPASTWVGTISNVTIETVTGAINPVLTIANSAGNANLEIRTGTDVNSTFIGLASGSSIAGAATINNTGIGSYALQNNTSGTNNAALGTNALKANTTGANNAAFGTNSLQANTTGYQNTATGYYSMRSNTTGYSNTANGTSSLQANTTGANNAAFGTNSLQANTTGSQSTAVGAYALTANTTAGNNVAIGYYSAAGTTSGSQNTAIGVSAGRANTTGTNNTSIGYYAGYNDVTQTGFRTLASLQYATAIGAYAQVQANDSIVLGSVDRGTKVGIGITIPSNMFSVQSVKYSAGTVTRTNASPTLTGAGTVWSTAGIVPGDIIIFTDGVTNTVQSVDSDTTITMTSNFTGTTGSGVAYRIHRQGFNVTSAGKVGIGKVAPAYDLDVQGDINLTGAYRINGTQGADRTCAAGQALLAANVAGGIVTGGTCSDVLTTATTLSGDVTGSYSSNTVTKIQNTNLNISGPVAGQVLVYTASGWTNMAVSGDATITSTGVLTISNNAITTAKITDGAVTGAKLAANAVTTDKIATGAVGNTDLAADAVTTDKISDGTIANTDLQAGTFSNITGTGALSAGSITSGFGTISTSSNITTTTTVQGGVVNAISKYQINSTDGLTKTCAAGQIMTGQVINGGIITGADASCATALISTTTFGGDVSGTYSAISVNKLQGTNLNITSPVAGQMLVYTASGWTNVALSGDATISTTGVLTIANGAITTAKLADNSVTSLKIVDGAVANADLAANAVTTDKIATGAVGNTDLAADAVTTDKISDGTITGTDIASGTVTSSNITDGTIANTDLQAGTFSNITGTGALSAGSITSGFGTISTSSNITTTTTVQGATVNVTGTYQVNGVQISSAALSNDANLAKLNGTGPQTFTGNNKFTGTVLLQNATNSSAAFAIQNAAGNTLFAGDTLNNKVGVGADVALTFNGADTAYIQHTAANNLLRLSNVSTGGDLQLQANDFFQVQADSFSFQNNVDYSTNFSISNTGAAYFKNRVNATNAFQILSSSSTPIFSVDTVNGRVGIGTNTPSADLSFGATTGVDRVIDVATRAANAAGTNLRVTAGAAGTGAAAYSGGTLTLSGGAAAGTGNANGGAVVVQGGAGVGTGTQGLVNLSTTAFTSASVQTFSSAGIANPTAGNVDLYSTLPMTATVSGVIVSIQDPSQSVAGRVLYIAARSGSQDFTLRLNAVRSPIDIAMKANSTATLIWNGTDWTAAGASSSTDLQSAYNNTLTSAGGAELVLNPSGGAADGLTIRNNATSPINGGVFEVQSSIGTNLFSVNNLGTELAANGGAENSGTFGTDWTSAPAGGTVTRSTTSLQYMTGQAGVQIVTTATIGYGARNNLSGNPVTGGAIYTVSFTAKSSTATAPMEVIYTPNGGTTLIPCDNYGGNQSLSSSVWTKITCTITTNGTAVSNPDLIIRQTDGTARTIYLDNLSFIRNDSTTQPSNIQIGGGITGGQVTLFTLDRSSVAPVANGNTTYFGSMYYDTTTGRIQCYEADGWGACGSAPDNIITLTPEYTGAVLNGVGVGTMTADFCANSTGGLSDNTLNIGSLCSAGEARNFYKWNSPQPTDQTYQIYATYKLPTTFKQFYTSDTVKLTALTSDTTKAGANLQVFKKTSTGGVNSCGTAQSILSSNNTWQTTNYVFADPDPVTGMCNFVGGDYIIFKITVSAKGNANVYVENLDFRYTNQ